MAKRMRWRIIKCNSPESYECFASSEDSVLIDAFKATMSSENFDGVTCSVSRIPPNDQECGRIEFEAKWNCEELKEFCAQV